MALCDPCLETRGIAVQHEFLGEIHIRQDGVRMAVLAHVDVDVRVAADDDMRAVTAAGGEEVPREELRALARAAWVVRGVVRLNEDVVFGGGACECVEVDGIGGCRGGR